MKSKKPVVEEEIKIPLKPLKIIENTFTDLWGNQSIIRWTPDLVKADKICQYCLTDVVVAPEIVCECPDCGFFCDACLEWKDVRRKISYKFKRKKIEAYHIDHNACCPLCGKVIYDYMVECFRS